ncbi:MAG: hypothetical protein HYT47_00300 [Candidatus Vogelbacteria bacterium]|nr:hypothetical protein [Candidatus Vogelbacteria bacterium]
MLPNLAHKDETTQIILRKIIGDSDGIEQFLDPGGHVANANWNADDGKFRVNWSNRDNANPNGGIRLEVSHIREP